MLSSSLSIGQRPYEAVLRRCMALRIPSTARHLCTQLRRYDCTRLRRGPERVEGEWYMYGEDASPPSSLRRADDINETPRGRSKAFDHSYGDGEDAVTARDERMERKHQLYKAAVALKATVESEIAAEVQRDAEDGAAAIPPLAPGGWKVTHHAGSSFFTMSKVIPGASRVALEEREDYALTHSGTAAAEDDASAAGEMRFRSTHEDHLRAARRAQLRHTPKDLLPIPTFPIARTKEGAELHTLLQAQRRKGEQRWRSSLAGSEARASADTGRVAVPRSDMHITLFAPFRVQDLSFYDPINNICEYACFDVVVRKQKPRELDARPSTEPAPPGTLRGQRAVWDDDVCLFLRLASANSELRLRSVQFVSHSAARRLEEAACFGHGDPFFVELLRRYMPVVRKQQRHPRQRGTQAKYLSGKADVTVDEDEFSPPMHRFLAEGPASQASSALPDGHQETSPSSAGTALLRDDFTLAGTVARAQLYGGPYMTELSKELQDALLGYVMTDLGVSGEVREYVCQMQYFLEQEEYLAWLAQLRHVADRLQKHTPTV